MPDDIIITTNALDEMFNLFKMMDVNEKFSQKDIKDIKNSLKVSVSNNKTFVILMAVNKEYSKNVLMKIKCFHGNPIGGYVYDSVTDSFSVHCVDYCIIGMINIAFKLSMDSSDNWNIDIPMSESIIKRYMNSEQALIFKRFKETYKQDVEYKYIQIINSI